MDRRTAGGPTPVVLQGIHEGTPQPVTVHQAILNRTDQGSLPQVTGDDATHKRGSHDGPLVAGEVGPATVRLIDNQARRREVCVNCAADHAPRAKKV